MAYRFTSLPFAPVSPQIMIMELFFFLESLEPAPRKALRVDGRSEVSFIKHGAFKKKKKKFFIFIFLDARLLGWVGVEWIAGVGAGGL